MEFELWIFTFPSPAQPTLSYFFARTDHPSCFSRKLCSSAFSLSEEELLGMRQEVHGCFAQMDRSLALPKIRARVLLQRFQTAWREAEFLKLDQAVAAPELQVGWESRGLVLAEAGAPPAAEAVESSSTAASALGHVSIGHSWTTWSSVVDTLVPGFSLSTSGYESPPLMVHRYTLSWALIALGGGSHPAWEVTIPPAPSLSHSQWPTQEACVSGLRKMLTSAQVDKGISDLRPCRVTDRCLCGLSHFRRVWFFVTPWTISHQVPLSMGFSRQEYWSGLPWPLPGVFLTQGLNSSLLHWQMGFFYL